MHLRLISIPGWDNKSLTISVFPFSDAIINGVPEKDVVWIPWKSRNSNIRKHRKQISWIILKLKDQEILV